MDIELLSAAISKSKVQESAGIALMKISMNNEKKVASQMTDMIKNVAVDPNLGQNLDAMA